MPPKSNKFSPPTESMEEKSKSAVKFTVPAADKARAEALAMAINIPLSDAMRICFYRFIRERGLPFPMVARDAPGAHFRSTPVSALGTTAGELARDLGDAFSAARRSHAATHDRDPNSEPGQSP